MSDVSYQLFTSAYYLFSSGLVPGNGYNDVGFPYTQSPGFGLNFLGADATYASADFSATVNLRWGNAAPLLTTIAPIKQAFVTWAPGRWTFDAGFFDTIYGAEVADEWANVNFSRGALYFLRQPFNHLGVRASTQIADDMTLTFLVANGDVGVQGLPAGEFETANVTPSVGAQFAYSSDSAGVAIGYLGGPNGAEFDNNGDFGHFLDLVVTYEAGALSIVGNADVTYDPSGPADKPDLLLGGSLALAYTVSDAVSVGGRYEFLSGRGADDDAKEVGLDAWLMTGTATLRYKPGKNLTFSVEPRVEVAEEPAFLSTNNGVTAVDDDFWFGVIFGVSGVISK